MPQKTGARRPSGNPLRGLLQIASGNPEGFTQFGADTHSYLTSLAPLVGFLIVYGGELMFTQGPRRSVATFFAYLISLLAPPVLAEPLCRRWSRLDAWGLYANMVNWSQILLIGISMLALLVAIVLFAAGVPLNAATAAAVMAVVFYAAWLQWFTARCTLNISRWQTIKLLLVTNFGTGILIAVPALMGPDFKP
jgi:hypothetical protein